MNFCLKEPSELLSHSARVYPGLLEGILGGLVHLLRGFASQKRGRFLKLRVFLGELLKRGRRIQPLLFHPKDFLDHRILHRAPSLHQPLHHHLRDIHSVHCSAAFPPVRFWPAFLISSNSPRRAL